MSREDIDVYVIPQERRSEGYNFPTMTYVCRDKPPPASLGHSVSAFLNENAPVAVVDKDVRE